MNKPEDAIEEFKRHGSERFYNTCGVKHVKTAVVRDFCHRCNELKMTLIDTVIRLVKSTGRPLPKLLDICSGPGSDLLKYKRHRLGFVAMVDSSKRNVDEMIERQRSISLPCKFEGHHLRVLKDEVPYEKEFFDIVACHFAITNFNSSKEDLTDFVTKCWTLLRKGGVLSLIMADSEFVRKNINSESQGIRYVGKDLKDHGCSVAFSLGNGMFFAEYFLPNNILEEIITSVGFKIQWKEVSNKCFLLYAQKI